MFVVTGATGRVGRVVAETLLSRHESVRVVVRRAEDEARWRARGADVVCASLDDAAAMTTALRGARGAFLLIPEDPRAEDVDRPRRAICEALDAAIARSRVPHVVLLSATAAALPDGNGPAAVLHYAERLFGRSAPQLTIVRAAAFQENLASLLEPARQHGVVPYFSPHADDAVPSVAVADVGRFAAARLLSPPDEHETIRLLGPAISARRTAELLAVALDRTIEVVPSSRAQTVAALIAAGTSRAYAESVAELYACLASGRLLPDDTSVVTAATTLEESLHAMLGVDATDEPVRAILEAIVDCWNRHDIDAFGRLYGDDADFVNIFGDWLRGRAAIVRDLSARHAGPFRQTTMRTRPAEIRRLRADVVVVHQRWRVAGNLDADGALAPDRAGVLFHLVVHRDGRWLIAATHNTQTPLSDCP